MRRLLIFLGLVTLLSLGLTWIADRPGEVTLAWSGYRLETSLFVAAIGFFALLFASIVVVQLLRAILHGPEAFRLFWKTRRREKGLQAVARGLVSVGAWDIRQALRATRRAENYLGITPLTMLLRSQTAQLTGDRAKARASFEAMLGDPQTRLLGLRGLYVEAQRSGDAENAAHYAETAAAIKGDLPWASQALLIKQARAGAWDDVLLTLKSQLRHRLIDRGEFRKLRAVALTAQAQAELEKNRDKARLHALEANRLDPGLVPAAALGAELLADIEDFKCASRILERAWKLSPHPELAQRYTHLRPGDSAKDRLKRARYLLRLKPEHPESLMMLATAAAEARDFPLSRETLVSLNQSARQRVCLLMAKIAEAENDTGAMRAWLDKALRAPRDPAWIADGQVLPAWAPIGPVSGELGAATWKVPQDEPRGALLLQEQMPNIPPALEDFQTKPLARPRGDHRRPVVTGSPPPAPFVPDDPGPHRAEDD